MVYGAIEGTQSNFVKQIETKNVIETIKFNTFSFSDI